MVVDLCPYCHNKCHNGGLEMIADGKNPRQEFMKIFGRNYL